MWFYKLWLYVHCTNLEMYTFTVDWYQHIQQIQSRPKLCSNLICGFTYVVWVLKFSVNIILCSHFRRREDGSHTCLQKNFQLNITTLKYRFRCVKSSLMKVRHEWIPVPCNVWKIRKLYLHYSIWYTMHNSENWSLFSAYRFHRMNWNWQ